MIAGLTHTILWLYQTYVLFKVLYLKPFPIIDQIYMYIFFLVANFNQFLHVYLDLLSLHNYYFFKYICCETNKPNSFIP